ncbi:MAG: polysaccharide pyruvyl transferase family protein [bacterium]
MKIGIVTIPPKENYGGVMQAYALQRILSEMGHEAYIIMPSVPVRRFKLNPYLVPLIYLKRFFKKYILRDKKSKVFIEKKLNSDMRVVRQHYIKFLDDNIPQYHCNKYQDIAHNEFDVFVVGSDQVWNMAHVHNIHNSYLGFAKSWNIKRYAYAASFGIPNLNDYSSDEVEVCRSLIKMFDAVSVREDVGVDLCRDYFDKDAKHVLDPTMLYDKEDYEKLIENESRQRGQLLRYFLESTKQSDLIISKFCDKLNLVHHKVRVEEKYEYGWLVDNIDNYIIPSPYKWLAGFRDAEFVVTDSFHGTIFSIIFNKPFVVMMKTNSGKARIPSLLNIFGLENRLINSVSELNEAHFAPIDYERVNKIKKEWQQRSFEFLRQI